MVAVVLPVTPVTTPVVETTEPFAGDRLVQVPPPEPEARVVFNPWQTTAVPVIAAGLGLTVSTDVVIHPVAVKVNVIVENKYVVLLELCSRVALAHVCIQFDT